MRAPNFTCPAIPPAPWQTGTPPSALDQAFASPVEIATPRSVTGLSGNSRLFSLVMAMSALPNVRGSCGRARSTAPVQRSPADSAGHANAGNRRAGVMAEICADERRLAHERDDDAGREEQQHRRQP